MPLYSATSPLPVNRIKNRLFDPDARAFFATAGVTDRVARGQINSFVIGVKALGLYNNMVCWPLRSTQNAGTGTTAYSLGGLGTYNGTLSSSGLRVTEGLSLATTSDFMSTSLNLGASPDSIIQVINVTETGGANAYTGGGVGASGRQFVLFSSGNPTLDILIPIINWYSPAGDGSFVSNGYPTRVGVRYMSYRPQSNTTLNVTVNSSNGSSTMAGWDTANSGQIKLAANSGTFIASFFCYISTQINDTLDASIRSLYKTTLGQGLGLP